MPHVQQNFDTLKYASHLKSYGFSERQAKGLIEGQNMAIGNLATKNDLELVRRELKHDFDLKFIQLDKRMDLLEVKITESAHETTMRLFTALSGVMGIYVAITIAAVGLTLHFMV